MSQNRDNIRYQVNWIQDVNESECYSGNDFKRNIGITSADIGAISIEYSNKKWSRSTKSYLLNGWLEEFKGYSWPGNVRELHRAIDLFFKGSQILFENMIKNQEKAENNTTKEPRNLDDILVENFTLNKVKALYLKHVLDKCNHNKAATARVLNISRPSVDSIIDREDL